MDRINILYLDDEINNLHSFKAKFRGDYSIFLANNTTEAYQILERETNIHIIISDQRMPDMTGVDFFASIIAKYPFVVRILLTGYSDITAVIDAINKGHVYRYLEKPWDDIEMQLAIDNAYQFYFINNQLKMKNDELRKINEELNRFAYSASHDLKAPVKSMQGILSLVNAENKGEQNKLLNYLSESVKKLDYFINNITDYYRNTRIEKTYTEIDFNKIVQDSIAVIEDTHNCNVKDIRFSINILQEIGFINDEFRINVLISYLLSNAIKYQKNREINKSIEIDIHVTEKKARIKISDNGIGIPEKHLEHIYKMFYRGTSQSTGSGIGLYIVKETLDKLDGRIQVISQEGVGTTFEIEIPNEVSL